MKNGILAMLFSLLPLCLFTQSAILPSPSFSTGIPTSLGMALGKGDIDAIANFLSNDVELTIPSMQAETVTKHVAKERLTEFYASMSPRGYHVFSVVDNTRESGELVTLNGNFKVSIVYRDLESKKQVDALSFTPAGDASVSAQ